MTALVCPRCWSYFGPRVQTCGDCGAQLINAERDGVLGGGRLDFAAETTPGIFAALEFIDIFTFLRGALIINGLLVLVLINWAKANAQIANGFLGSYIGNLLLKAPAHNVYIALVGVGAFFAFWLVFARARSLRMIQILAWAGALLTEIVFGVMRGFSTIGFLVMCSEALVAWLLWRTLRMDS